VGTDIDHYDHRLAIQDTPDGNYDFSFGGQPFLLDPSTIQLPRFFQFWNSKAYEEWQRGASDNDVGSEEDKKRLAGILNPKPTLNVEPLSSGNFIVKSDRFKKTLKKRKRTTSAADTETAAIAEFVQQQHNPYLKFFAIRGFSDDGVNKAFLDQFKYNEYPRYQVLATRNAASLLKRMLDEGLFCDAMPSDPLVAFTSSLKAKEKAKANFDDMKSLLVEHMSSHQTRTWAYFINPSSSDVLLYRKITEPDYPAAFKSAVMKTLKKMPPGEGEKFFNEIQLNYAETKKLNVKERSELKQVKKSQVQKMEEKAELEEEEEEDLDGTSEKKRTSGKKRTQELWSDWVLLILIVLKIVNYVA